jgi:hypothetical protein
MTRDAAFYRYLAQRCGEYIAQAKTQVAKDQFELWQIEFEAQAEAAAEAEAADVCSTY